MQTEYLVFTKLGDRYYLTKLLGQRPMISKTKAIAKIFLSKEEAKEAVQNCEAWSGFAYYIEEAT